MAWIDDRIWCHSKIVPLSDAAFRVHFNAIAYSAGMGLGGRLEAAHQKLMGSTSKVRAELVDAGLWDEDGSAISIHDWDEHNGKRDDRRKADRERKREARAKERQSAGTSAGQSAGRSTGPACVEGSEGSEGSEGTNQRPAFRTIDPLERLLEVLTDADSGTRGRIAALALRYRLNEGDFEEARQAAMSESAQSPTAVAYSVLEKRGKQKEAA